MSTAILINCFEVAPDQDEHFLTLWKRADELLRSRNQPAHRADRAQLRRLLNTLIRTPLPDLDHAADWSWWRRRRQAQARAAHYRAPRQDPP